MATGGGIEYSFVEDLPSELICPICNDVLSEPHMVNCCEKCYCKRCLDKWLARKNSCPHCRSTDFSSILLKQKSRKIGELKVYCPNKQHGCLSTLKITEYDNHLSTTNDEGCLYVKLNCPNNCEATVFRGDLKTHTDIKCPRRTVKCAHCKKVGEFQQIVDHTKTCPLHPLACPQKCGATVLRKDLETHQDTCPLEVISCSFSELGCKVKVCRKDLEKHDELSLLQHMSILAKSHMTLQAEHAALKKLQNEHSGKLQAIGLVVKEIPKASEQVAEIYDILTNTSVLTIGDKLFLKLLHRTNLNKEHYVIVSGCKFKLKWRYPNPPLLPSPRPPPPTYICTELKIYLVRNPVSAAWQCDVKIDSEVVLTICCGKDQSGAAYSCQLIGTWNSKIFVESVEIVFAIHK